MGREVNKREERTVAVMELCVMVLIGGLGWTQRVGFGRFMGTDWVGERGESLLRLVGDGVTGGHIYIKLYTVYVLWVGRRW